MVPTTNILFDLLEARAAGFADYIALCIKDRDHCVELTYAELFDRSRRLAAALIEAGIEEGDRVAILSESRPEWGVAFLGSICAGAIVVPLDTKLTETELDSILDDCRPKLLFVSPSSSERARSLRGLAPSIAHVFLLDADLGSGDGAASTPRFRRRPTNDTAAIVYISATAGSPKGVMITYANLVFQVEAVARAIDVGAGDRVLSVLPLNHLLELTCGFLAALSVGATVCYTQTLFPHQLAELMRERRVSSMIGVPLLFRSLKGWIERQIDGDRRLFGDALRVFISGGAPLDPEVARFFDRLGVPVLEGYGLTETSPVISVNTLGANRIGSVGRPLSGVDVAVDREGEILTRGPHVMKGYYRRDDLTHEVIDSEGWFHTGDVGSIDADGFLHVTGRLKSLIVLGNGKKVDPEEVEVSLSRASSIKETCVLGRRPAADSPHDAEEVCAVAVPADSRRWRECPESVSIEIRTEIAQLTRDLAPYKRPSKIYVHANDLPRTRIDTIRRPLVREWLDQLACGASS
jgi:long-chain acyl-CoA synthetase